MNKEKVIPLNDKEIEKVLQWLEQNSDEDLGIGYQAALDMVGAVDVECVKAAILSIPDVSYGTYNRFLDVVYDLRDKLGREIFDALKTPNIEFRRGGAVSPSPTTKGSDGAQAQ